MTIIDRLLANITDNEDGCWEWIGATNVYGYGIISYESKQRRVHRLAYELEFGKIPTGMLVCHKCDNRRCCNPQHLFLGTYQDNVDDMRGKHRDAYGQNKGEINGASRLKSVDIPDIRRMLVDGHTKTYIGQIYNVSRKTITKIAAKQTWGHI